MGLASDIRSFFEALLATLVILLVIALVASIGLSIVTSGGIASGQVANNSTTNQTTATPAIPNTTATPTSTPTLDPLNTSVGDVLNGSNNTTSAPAANRSNANATTNQSAPGPNSTNQTASPNATNQTTAAQSGGSQGDSGNGGDVLPDGPIERLEDFLAGVIQDVLDAVIGTIDQVKNTAIRGITITPSANDPGNFYQNPSNLAYPQVRTLWNELGQPLAIVGWLLSLGGLFLFGRTGFNLIGWAIEKRLWMGLFVTAILVSEMGWVIANLVPNLIDIFVQALLFDFTEQSVSDLGISALLIVIALVGLYFEAFVLIGLAILAAVRIEVIMFMTPVIPVLFVLGWAFPAKILRTLSQTGIIVWAVLLVSGIPSGLFISGAMTISQSGALDSLGLGSAAALIFQLGGFLAALVSPVVVLKTMLPLLALAGPTGVSETSEKVSEKNQQYRDQLRRDRQRAAATKQAGADAKDGLRDNQLRNSNGQFRTQTRAYRATNKIRNAPSAVKDRAAAIRERTRRN